MEAVPRSVVEHRVPQRRAGADRQLSSGRFVARFYKGPLTYAMSYWYGSLGTVTLGPDFLHLHLMFALRRADDGSTEGQTLAFTKQRRGPLGWLVNRVLLRVTALAARYFATATRACSRPSASTSATRFPPTARCSRSSATSRRSRSPRGATSTTRPRAPGRPPARRRRPTRAQRWLSASVLVTGCSSGFGLGIAQALAARGWSVTPAMRDPARAPAAARRRARRARSISPTTRRSRPPARASTGSTAW